MLSGEHFYLCIFITGAPLISFTSSKEEKKLPVSILLQNMFV